MAFELEALIEEVTAPLRDAALDRGLSIAVLLPASVPRHLLGDPDGLRRVLGILVGHAVQSTEEGLVAVRVRVEAAEDAEIALSFAIEESGSGMAADDEPAELAACRQLCAMMGGGISVHPTPDEGTIFRFTARFAPAPSAASPVPPPTEAPDEERIAARVLLVEDNQVNLLVGTSLLHRIGCTVVTAATGREALERFAPGRFDVILMDCQMPDIDGFEATAAIRAREAGEAAHTPIVALTAAAFEGDRDRCLEAGMDDYLAKPFRLAELRRMVARWSGAQ